MYQLFCNAAFCLWKSRISDKADKRLFWRGGASTEITSGQTSSFTADTIYDYTSRHAYLDLKGRRGTYSETEFIQSHIVVARTEVDGQATLKLCSIHPTSDCCRRKSPRSNSRDSPHLDSKTTTPKVSSILAVRRETLQNVHTQLSLVWPTELVLTFYQGLEIDEQDRRQHQHQHQELQRQR